MKLRELTLAAIVLVLGGCKSMPQTGISSAKDSPSAIPTNLSLPIKLVVKPRYVFVNFDSYMDKLSRSGSERYIGYVCDLNKFGPIEPFYDYLPSEGAKGDDERYERVSKFFRRSGSGCMSGAIDQCDDIKLSALEWSKGKFGSVYGDFRWTLNARLIRPMVNALSVAHWKSPMTDEEFAQVTSWLLATFRQSEETLVSIGINSEFNVPNAAHNHAVMSAATSMALGAWSNNDELFRKGLNQWFLTLNTMRSDGSLPLETRRGGLAAFYTSATLTALISIAEMAKVQGIDLYTARTDEGKDINQAISFYLDVIENPEVIFPYAKREFAASQFNKSLDYRTQVFSHSNPNGDQTAGHETSAGWVQPYINQFPSSQITQRIRSITGNENSLSRVFYEGVKSNGTSGSWIGLDGQCFYSDFSQFK